MNNVTRELLILKKKVSSKKYEMQQNERIHALQQEKEYF
jgi:hypothetical protein